MPLQKTRLGSHAVPVALTDVFGSLDVDNRLAMTMKEEDNINRQQQQPQQHYHLLLMRPYSEKSRDSDLPPVRNSWPCLKEWHYTSSDLSDEAFVSGLTRLHLEQFYIMNAEWVIGLDRGE